uniref:Uncharacterized protein n=1 Tax=viral metagenome TaxID=1070528 RepID=A0A6M3MDG3_9ZZZZ
MEPLIRKEQAVKDNLANAAKMKKFTNKMRSATALMSKDKAGLNVLRFILHESRFLSPLTHETEDGLNKDILLQNEAKRNMYLSLRIHMDRDTIIRVELPNEETPKQED